MLCFCCALLLVATAQTGNGLVRRRIPVTVSLPQYIRMSPDPKTTDAEKIVAMLKGVNVCVKREEIPKSTYEKICEMNRCERLNTVVSKMEAKDRLYFTKYDCCFGYEKLKQQNGCPKAAFYSLHDTIQVAGELGLSKFVYLVKKSKLHHVLSKIKPITIFIPSNFALEQYLETESGKKILENESALRIFIVMHVFGGEWPEMLIKQRRKLENFLPGKGREMNIKIYDKNIVIQNALVIKKDQPASNGVVYVINSVLKQSYGSIQGVLGHHRRLKIFSEGLKLLNYQLNGFNTIFAPTDDVFKKLGIESSKDLAPNFQCVKELILTHIVHGLFFTAILHKRGRLLLRNHIGDILPILKFRKNIYVRNMLVEMKYIAATDGSIYTIDRLLTRSKTIGVQKILKKISSVSRIVEMMIKTNFEQLYLEKHESSTLFLPSNEAVTRMKPSSLDNLKKKDALIEFLLNHVALGKYHTREFRPNMVLESRTNNSILINKRNNRKICVQGSSMSYRLKNIEACNAIVHVITKHPIQYSKYSLLDKLRNDSRFSVLTMALEIAGMSEYIAAESPLTLFAPTNDAWSELDNETLTSIFEDSKKLRYIIKYHLIQNAIYSCDVMAGKIAPYSLTGTRVRISRSNSYSDSLLFNYAETIESDITAKNGVLHVINKVVRYLYKRKHNG